jgi:hypothetical protein
MLLNVGARAAAGAPGLVAAPQKDGAAEPDPGAARHSQGSQPAKAERGSLSRSPAARSSR